MLGVCVCEYMASVMHFVLIKTFKHERNPEILDRCIANRMGGCGTRGHLPSRHSGAAGVLWLLADAEYCLCSAATTLPRAKKLKAASGGCMRPIAAVQ